MAKAKSEPSLTLKFYEHDTLQYSYFTAGERAVALHVAERLDARNMRPRLYSTTLVPDAKLGLRAEFRTLYDYESRARKKAAKPAVKHKKAA